MDTLWGHRGYEIAYFIVEVEHIVVALVRKADRELLPNFSAMSHVALTEAVI
jgi:hypothetical protein